MMPKQKIYCAGFAIATLFLPLLFGKGRAA